MSKITITLEDDEGGTKIKYDGADHIMNKEIRVDDLTDAEFILVRIHSMLNTDFEVDNTEPVLH